mgnify:CR=1 FL=1
MNNDGAMFNSVDVPFNNNKALSPIEQILQDQDDLNKQLKNKYFNGPNT